MPPRRRRRKPLPLPSLALLLVLSLAGDTLADPPAKDSETSASWGSAHSLLQRFGLDVARRLVRGGESVEPEVARADVLRGIERAVGLGTPEGIAILVPLLADPHGLARADATILLAVTRALAPFAKQHPVGHALADLVLNAPHLHPSPGGPGSGDEAPSLGLRDPYRRARVELARETAAIALARAGRAGDAQATEALLASARRVGAGQAAATRALVAFPPAVVSAPAVVTSEAIALDAALHDLRARDAVLEASQSIDRTVRLAGLRGVGALGDARGAVAAKAALEDADPLVREAACHTLVDLGAPEATSAVRRLIEDDATVRTGIALSVRVAGDEIAGALASRVHVSADLGLQRSAIAALGRQADAGSLAALTSLLTDPLLAGDAAEAIARSEANGAWETIAGALGQPSLRRMGTRMAAVRGRVLGRPPAGVLRSLGQLAHDGDANDRASGLAALVLLGTIGPESGLADPEVAVRRAVILASEPTSTTVADALAHRLAVEKDPPTRLLLARHLVVPDARMVTTSTELRERLRAGGIDAPMASLELARRGEDDAEHEAIQWALGSADPLVRAHAAMGLARSPSPWAVGLLANAYDSEIDPAARRTIVFALAARRGDADVPLRARALNRAALYDPEESIRVIADNARLGLLAPEQEPSREVAWLRVMMETGAPPAAPLVQGVLVRADGLAVPVAFDADGYALVPAPRGPARLLLAPRLGVYQAPSHGE